MKVEKDGETLSVLFLDRQISDEARIMEIGDELNEIASHANASSLVLDLKNLEYFSSAMVGQLVQLRKAMQRDGVELILTNVSSTIQDILSAMHLNRVFHIENPQA